MPTSRSEPRQSITVDIRSSGDVTVVVLIGDLDTNTSRIVRPRVLPLAEPGSRMVIDLSQVAYMSSAGLRFLLSLYRHSANQDGKLVLVGISGEIHDTMEVTGFLDFFTACSTLEDALQELGEELGAAT